jgi:4-hydroxy-tetrahydrodipicolinate synthase
MFKGSFTALITPFRGGKVDEDAFAKFVEWQIAEGTHGLVPCGTTGESPTLSTEEHKRVIALCVEVARKRVPIVAGCGSNSTEEAIDLTAFAKSAGADATLQVMPYYNKPTQEGLYLHVKAINDAVDLPIILYNVPVRTITDMSVATMVRAAKLKNVIGVKDATANVARVTQQRNACGEKFVQLSGEDGTCLGFMAHGGVGCISVTSNIAPRLCADFQNACLAGEWQKALVLQDKLMPLHDSMFCETNPAPVKYAAARLGLCAEDCRLPLAPLTDASRKAVDKALADIGLTKRAVAAE